MIVQVVSAPTQPTTGTAAAAAICYEGAGSGYGTLPIAAAASGGGYKAVGVIARQRLLRSGPR
jgi:hypothetical protein